MRRGVEKGGVLEKREGVMEKKGWWGAGWPSGEGMVQPESKFVVKIMLKSGKSCNLKMLDKKFHGAFPTQEADPLRSLEK